jgi:hypothetical protein
MYVVSRERTLQKYCKRYANRYHKIAMRIRLIQVCTSKTIVNLDSAYATCWIRFHTMHNPIYIFVVHIKQHLYVKLIRYQFWCTRCAFRLLRSVQWSSGKTSWKSEKQTVKTVKESSDENQTECHYIELNPWKNRAMPEGDNPSFWDEFIKFTFVLTVQFIFV